MILSLDKISRSHQYLAVKSEINKAKQKFAGKCVFISSTSLTVFCVSVLSSKTPRLNTFQLQTESDRWIVGFRSEVYSDDGHFAIFIILFMIHFTCE